MSNKRGPCAVWTVPDETALLDYLVEQKSAGGDGANFKAAVWTSAADHVNSTKTRGGLKTKDSCRAKYQAVCEFPLHIEYTLTPTLNF